jgi:hypothetical protein
MSPNSWHRPELPRPLFSTICSWPAPTPEWFCRADQFHEPAL